MFANSFAFLALLSVLVVTPNVNAQSSDPASVVCIAGQCVQGVTDLTRESRFRADSIMLIFD